MAETAKLPFGVTVKPPLGLRPRFIALQERAVEIVEAMERYHNAQKEIPAAWKDELQELNAWLEKEGWATYTTSWD